MYKLQNQHENDWKDEGCTFDEEWKALRKALECAKSKTVRVINEEDESVVVTFVARGENDW